MCNPRRRHVRLYYEENPVVTIIVVTYQTRACTSLLLYPSVVDSTEYVCKYENKGQRNKVDRLHLEQSSFRRRYSGVDFTAVPYVLVGLEGYRYVTKGIT